MAGTVDRQIILSKSHDYHVMCMCCDIYVHDLNTNPSSSLLHIHTHTYVPLHTHSHTHSHTHTHTHTYTELYNRGLIYFNIPIANTDIIVVPPLQGFVMNRVQGDYFETLLYKIFVSIDEHTNIGELASVLQVDLQLVKVGVVKQFVM